VANLFSAGAQFEQATGVAVNSALVAVGYCRGQLNKVRRLFVQWTSSFSRFAKLFNCL